MIFIRFDSKYNQSKVKVEKGVTLNFSKVKK